MSLDEQLQELNDDSSTVVVRRSGKRKLFTYNVEPKLFDMFRRGKKKYEKWAKYLDLEDEAQGSIFTKQR